MLSHVLVYDLKEWEWVVYDLDDMENGKCFWHYEDAHDYYVRHKTYRGWNHFDDKQAVFWDLQTGGCSAHTTIKGLAEMHMDDLVVDGDENDLRLFKELAYTRDIAKLFAFIRSLEYEILPPTVMNIAKYEEYHDLEYRVMEGAAEYVIGA